MRTIKRTFSNLSLSTLLLGRAGENLVTKLELDVSKENREFSNPVYELVLKMPASDEPYPVLVDVSGNTVSYTFNGSDLAQSGYGELEALVCNESGDLLKSTTARTKIEPSIIPNTYPGPLQKVIDDIREEIGEIAERSGIKVVEELPATADPNTIVYLQYNGVSDDPLNGFYLREGSEWNCIARLTTNDFTDAEKNKLDGIETGAEVNDIDSITVNGTPVTVTNKTAEITAVQDDSYVHTDNNYTNSEKAKLSSVKLTEVIEANLVWTTEEAPTVTLVTQNAYSKITSALTNGDEIVLVGHLFSLMEGQAEPVDVGTLLFVKSFDYDLGGAASVSFTTSPSDGLFYRLEIDSSNTAVFTQTSLDGKVDKETGKGLSTNDYTTADQNKLNGIASGAEVNVIESISYNGSPVSVVSKAVSINPDALTSLTEAASITLETNKKYYLTLASNASFVLPVSPSVLYDNQILVYLDCTADVDVSFPSGTLFYGGTLPDTSTGAHELIMTYNPAASVWTVGGLDSEAVT